MVGRAGRAGLGETGESILICDSTDLPKVQKLLMSPMDEALSSLHEDKGRGLRYSYYQCIHTVTKFKISLFIFYFLRPVNCVLALNFETHVFLFKR